MISRKINVVGLHAKNMPRNTLTDTNHPTNVIVTLVQEGDDLILPIPKQVLNDMQLNTDDVIEWHLQPDNTIVLKKVS